MNNKPRQLAASVFGGRCLVTDAKSGTQVVAIPVGPGATHAIAQGDLITIHFKEGGTRTYNSGGGMISFQGSCK